MVRFLACVSFALVLALPAAGQGKKGAAAEPGLVAAHGVIDKADKDSVVVKPRDASGRFQKTITLKIAGTSKVAVLTPQKRGDKTVLTQREASPADLVAGQVVAVIYAEGGADGPVLLSAVVQSAK
jgi:hypothetical protein